MVLSMNNNTNYEAGNMIKIEPRKEWIDFLRSIAMLFVIFGHQWEGNTYFVFTSPIKIPLFFMISGYVFNYKRDSVREFVISIIRKLVVPWIVLTIPYMVVYFYTRGIAVINDFLIQPFYGGGAWYMPCCIIAECIWFVNYKATQKPIITLIIAAFISGLGFICAFYNIANFAMLNRAMIAQLFFGLGYTYLLMEKRNKIAPDSLVLILWSLYLFLCYTTLLLWPGKCIDFHNNVYYNYIFCILIMIIGCYACFFSGKRTRHIPRVFIFIGQNTLVFYMLHPLNITLLLRIIGFFGIKIGNDLLGTMIKFTFACISCGIESLFINRYLPEVAGKKRLIKK